MHIQKKQIISVSFFIIGIFAICLGCILGFSAFPKIIKKNIKENIRLEYGLDMYKNWLNPRISTIFKIYFFNISNPEEASKGAKPIVKEIGPYAFKKTITRHHPAHFPDIDAIWYEERTHIEFDPKNTGPGLKEDDEITIVNVALLSSIWYIANMVGEEMISSGDEVLKSIFINYKLFQTGKAADLLFYGVLTINCTEDEAKSSMTNMACGQLRKNLPPNVWETEPNIFYSGILKQLNTSQEPPLKIDHSLFNEVIETEEDALKMKEIIRRTFLISRGTKNVNEIGTVKRYMGKDKLDFWGEGECQNIKGTDTSIFQPLLEKKPIDVFITLLCRSASLVFKNELQYGGIKAYDYEMDPEMYNYSDEKNYCYCNNNTVTNCPINGTIDLTPCYGAHVMISNPHFLNGHQDLINFVSGIKPENKKHRSYAILDQLTGIPLKGVKSIQFNCKVKAIEGIEPLENAPSGIFPVMWAEEDFEMNHLQLSEVQNIHNRINLLDWVKWILIVIGIILILIGFYLQWKLKKEIEHHQLLLERNKKMTEEPKQTFNSNRNTNQIIPMESTLYPNRNYTKNATNEDETRVNKIEHSQLQD